jgi:hypothetical protein
MVENTTSTPRWAAVAAFKYQPLPRHQVNNRDGWRWICDAPNHQFGTWTGGSQTSYSGVPQPASTLARDLIGGRQHLTTQLCTPAQIAGNMKDGTSNAATATLQSEDSAE